MSIDSFNLAPAQNTQAGATTTNPTPNPAPTGPAPAQTPRKQKTTEPGPTVAGVVVPGAALTGLISLCWLIHQFGLPAVLLGIGACAAAASAALAMKAHKGAKRVSAARKAAVRSAGGAGPGGTVLRSRTAPSPGSRPSGSSGKGRASSAARKPAGLSVPKASKQSAAAKPAGKPTGSKPTGVTSAVKPVKNRTPKGSGTLSPKSAALGGNTTPSGRGTKRSLASRLPGQKRTTSATTPKKNGAGHTGAKTSRPTPTPAAGKAGRMARLLGRKTTAPAPTVKGSTTKPGAPKTLPAKASKQKHAKAARANAKTTPRTPKTGHLKPKTVKPVTGKKAARIAKKGKKPATLTHKPTAHMSRMRHATYLASTKLRKHTSKKTRMRIRRVISPARTTSRAVSRLLSPPLAHAWRWTSRGFLAWHMALGSIRYTDAGPNWVRNLAKFLHIAYSPAARAIAATGSWGWLNRWMYQHTSTPALTDRTAAPDNPNTGPQDEGDNWTGMFGTRFNPPAPHTTVTTPGGIPVSEYAAPLEQAIDAVNQAGAMLLTNPAENMVGYEATLRALSNLQAAIGDAVGAAGETTRDNFKVNPAVAEAYDDTASYARSLAARLDEIPVLFRSLHEEQIENIENPTVQARKWDISANE